MGCRVTDEEVSAVPGGFQQPEEGVTLLLLRSPGCCGENVAGSVSGRLSSQSICKSPRSSAKEMALEKHKAARVGKHHPSGFRCAVAARAQHPGHGMLDMFRRESRL